MIRKNSKFFYKWQKRGHCAILSLTKSSGRAFVFHGRGNLAVNLFGWIIEEGLFTSSNWDEAISPLRRRPSQRRLRMTDEWKARSPRFLKSGSSRWQSRLSLRNPFLDEVKRPCLCLSRPWQSFPFSCHCEGVKRPKQSRSKFFGWSIEEGLFTSSNWAEAISSFLFVFGESPKGVSPPLRIKAISPLILFGWSIEEGLFTSSTGKGEIATLP